MRKTDTKHEGEWKENRAEKQKKYKNSAGRISTIKQKEEEEEEEEEERKKRNSWIKRRITLSIVLNKLRAGLKV